MHGQLRCGSLSITTPASLLTNKFDVLSILHGQVSLVAVSQTCVIHETRTVQKFKDTLKDCFKNVNITL